MQLLATTLHPTLEARKAAEICFWHWKGGLLTLLPSVRASVPNIWQLDVFLGLTEASFRSRSPSDMIISPAESSSMVQILQRLNTADRESLLQPNKDKATCHHGKRAVPFL